MIVALHLGWVACACAVWQLSRNRLAEGTEHETSARPLLHVGHLRIDRRRRQRAEQRPPERDQGVLEGAVRLGAVGSDASAQPNPQGPLPARLPDPARARTSKVYSGGLVITDPRGARPSRAQLRAITFEGAQALNRLAGDRP